MILSENVHECLKSKGPQGFAIYKMLKAVHKIADASSWREYVRSFVVSMTHEAADLRAAQDLVRRIYRRVAFPIVPLFETRQALASAPKIVLEFLSGNSVYRGVLDRQWQGA